MNTVNIMIVGVGGQGTLLASRILGNAILSLGYDVKVSEVHGMSQRGGSVVTYVKYTGHCEITDKCKKCKLCMKLGCPAISVCEDGSVKIDTTQCNGCGLCLGVCPFGAIEKKED